MGIVLSHTIVALFLHYRNRDRHFAQGAVDQNSFSERFLDQEALSSLDNVTRIRDLYSTIREVLTTLLHRNVNSIVYIADEKTGELYADREKNHVAPSHGIVRETIETQQFHVQSTDVAEDPVIAVLRAQCKLPANWNPKTVYCLPVTDEENQKILALIVIEDSATVEINKITPLKHKIVGCYRRLCKCHRDSSSNYAPSNMPNSATAGGSGGDKDAILRLCGDLYDQDASRLQLKVIRFLEDQTNAECAFLLLVVPETQELFCQVIGGLVLEEEVKFPGQNSVFSLPLDSKKPMKLEDVPLDKRKEIENFVGVKLKSMLCVPVSSRNSDGLIALACVVNKKDAENFSNEDLQTILQCFQYTSTVLTSTLAFQNERKLKLQTQAMLQVARNLFTHLGEFSIKHNEELVSYTNLTQFLAMYKEQVTIPNRRRRESVHKNSNGSAKTCHSISLTESTSYRHERGNNFSSPTDSVLGERSSKYFRSQLETSSGEKIDSHHTECSFSQSSSQKSLVKRKYFSSVYIQNNEDNIENKNEEFSPSFEKEVETVQLPLESECIHKKEEIEVKKCHLENNIKVIQADFKEPMSGVSNSRLTQVESGVANESSDKNGPAIVDEFIQLKEIRSITVPPHDFNFTDLTLIEPKEDSDQNKEGNAIEMSDRIEVPVKEQSKTDNIAAGNSLLIETPGDNSSASTTEEVGKIQLFKAESEQCIVTEESIHIEANNEFHSKEKDQMDISNRKNEIGESLPEQNLAARAHSEPGSSGSFLSCAKPKVLDAENKSDDIDTQLNSSIRMIESVKEEMAVIESESDNNFNDSVPASMSPLKTAVTNNTDKIGMKHNDLLDSLEIDTLKVPSEQITLKSFHTAKDETLDTISVESVAASDQEIDMDDSDEKMDVFYDTFTERSIVSSMSEQGLYNSLLDRSMLESPTLSPELKTRKVRLSKSDPIISKESVIRLEYMESRPSLNYAFVEDMEPFTDPLSMRSSDLDSVIEGLGLIPSSSSPTKSIKIVVENTTSHETHCFSHQNVPNLSGHSSLDSFSKRGSGCSFEKFDRDLEYIKQQQPPTTDTLNVTINDLTKLLREIMQEARNLTQAERCSVFLIDKETKELVAEVFDGISTNNKEEYNEIRMPITQGIAGHVATTGKLLNIKDAYSHPMFYRGIDDSTGFRTRNILCFPIKNEKGDVLGVAQLCNKKTGQHFTEFDEDLASAFAVYCCISISHCLMYKKLQDSQHRNRLANELMIYHMQISPDDVEKLLHRDIPSVTLWGEEFDKFPFPPREIPDPDTPLCVLAMFEDLGFNSRWRIRKDTLVRFVLMVKKGYRNPPYHNWTHAFAVAHFCYLCVKNLSLQQSLDDIELLALFVSCLCHDLDHRGTNNQYQVASKSVLAALYSSEGSVMERHHFAQTMCIVNTEGCNIFENLSSKDYTSVLDLVRDIILATDLSHHLKIMNSLKDMAKVGYDNKNERHHSLLLCLLMTASDLSDQTKPWDNTKHVAALIYREFFSQGDMEKSLGQKPAEMMDRERARIPDLQIGFLDHIALPVYKLLADLFPASEIVRDTVVDNRRHWEKICALIKIRRGGSCEQMSYDQILALEEEEANAEIENYNLQNQKQNGR